MRMIRLLLTVVLFLVLVGIAIANREPVALSLMPASVAAYLGVSTTVHVPLFLVILLTLLAGLVIGLIWEWLREAELRSESSRRAQRIASLERETGALRTTFSAPRDEVLAIIDAPTARAASGDAGALPAPR